MHTCDSLVSSSLDLSSSFYWAMQMATYIVVYKDQVFSLPLAGIAAEHRPPPEVEVMAGYNTQV